MDYRIINSMKKLGVTFLLIILTLPTYAWGATGHRVTGWIAEKHINKKAKKELNRILGGQSLAMVSNWMDEIRSDSTYDYAVDWHFVTIPQGKTYAETKKNPNGDLIQTIERLIAALKSKKLNAKDESEHLKMLIHLIGDIHQPLHVGVEGDHGGNDIKVTWFRAESNLHRVWDSEMIDDSRLSYTELAESLEKPDETKISSWQKSTVQQWATESISYRDNVYNYGNGKLGYKYTYQNFHIVRHRLLQAGIRLAGVLNDIYG
jgi:S1/P1 Nuclease